MTQEQIPPLPGAGWELDKLVAEKQGFRVVKNSRFGDYTMELATEPGHYYEMPSYSTDIGAAWEIVRHMRSRGYTFHIYEDDRPGHGNYWVAGFNTRDITKACGGSQHRGETEPLAICLSFLQLPDEAVKE